MRELPQKFALPSTAAAYFPPASGTYEVKPNLRPLGTDLGNGAADSQLFQVDAGYGEYRRVKQRARAERLGKYYQTRDFSPEVAGPVCRFIARRLAEEHPTLFVLDAQPGEWTLRSALHGETLRFDPEMRHAAGEMPRLPTPTPSTPWPPRCRRIWPWCAACKARIGPAPSTSASRTDGRPRRRSAWIS